MPIQSYREVVDQILGLKWENLDGEALTSLMFVSLGTAQEFAESLRVALEFYPDDLLLRAMAAEELDTRNLQYSYYHKSGDHSQFLDYFLFGRIGNSNVCIALQNYKQVVRGFTPALRAMSIFSREQELPGIFTKILAASVWRRGLPKHLNAFRYYLQKHVELDSQEGGHGDLVRHHELTEELLPFYQARLCLYRDAVPVLK